MAGGGPFPTKDADFNDYIQHVQPYLVTNIVHLSISPTNVASLNSQFTQWNNIYQKSQDKQQRTSAITAQKNTVRKQFEVVLRNIYNDIPNSVLTDADRQSLNIKARDFNPTPTHAPDHAPTLSVDKIGHLFHEVRFRDPNNPASKAKPAGVNQHEVWVAYTPINSNGMEFELLGNTGKFLFQVDFNEERVGLLANYKARYVSTRGEKGPWSEIVSAVMG